MNEAKYAVRVKSEGGRRYWVSYEDSWFTGSETVHRGVYVWDTPEEAHKFASSWKGHPYWVVPESYEVIPMKPRMEQSGWEPVNTEVSP